MIPANNNCIFTYISDFIRRELKKVSRPNELDHEKVSELFLDELQRDFEEEKKYIVFLICAGFIPEEYAEDSSEETLYSKLIEAVVCDWAHRIGLSASLVKQKASKEDITISFNDGNYIVCDAKSFRLGRSQKAPNVKDFVKPEAFKLWINQYETKSTKGGLVTYPVLHEWEKKSDVYKHCSDKENPIVMLPYRYLALIYSKRKSFKIESFLSLWDYNKIFPSVANGKENKKQYWEIIRKQLSIILNIQSSDIDQFDNEADKIEEQYVDFIIQSLNDNKDLIENNVKQEVDNLSEDVLREELFEYRIKSETEDIQNRIQRINRFRKKNIIYDFS